MGSEVGLPVQPFDLLEKQIEIAELVVSQVLD